MKEGILVKRGRRPKENLRRQENLNVMSWFQDVLSQIDLVPLRDGVGEDHADSAVHVGGGVREGRPEDRVHAAASRGRHGGGCTAVDYP